MTGFIMNARPDPAPPVSNTYRWAVVTDDSPLTIQLDGDTLPLALIPDCLCDPLSLAVGDRVWTQLYGRRVVVHGAQGGGTGPRVWPNEAVTRMSPSGSGSTSSGAAVDWPSAHGGPLVVSLLKRSAATRIIVSLNVTGFVDTASSVTPWSVAVDTGVSTDMIWAYWNAINTHLSWSGQQQFTGLAAGARTFTLRARTSGTVLRYDTGDQFDMTVREVAP